MALVVETGARYSLVDFEEAALVKPGVGNA
jgi:hypothetical protein